MSLDISDIHQVLLTPFDCWIFFISILLKSWNSNNYAAHPCLWCKLISRKLQQRQGTSALSSFQWSDCGTLSHLRQKAAASLNAFKHKLGGRAELWARQTTWTSVSTSFIHTGVLSLSLGWCVSFFHLTFLPSAALGFNQFLVINSAPV